MNPPQPPSRHKSAFFWAIGGMMLTAAVSVAAIFRSTSSTAGIGLFFIPFYVLPFGLLFYLFGYCLHDLRDWIQGRNTPLKIRAKLRALIAIVLPLWAGGVLIHGFLLVRTVDRISKADEAELGAFLNDSMFNHNRFALGALAVNPNATSALLDHIARLPDPVLHRKMGSLWPVMPGNENGLAVMRLVAKHPNVSETTLLRLSKSPDAYVLGAVAANGKTPVSLIRQLAASQDPTVRWGLATNPAAPPDILQTLASDSSEYTRARVAGNPDTPVETLEVLAADKEWNVRRSVAANRHTLPATLDQLAQDPDERVQAGLSHRSHRAAK